MAERLELEGIVAEEAVAYVLTEGDRIDRIKFKVMQGEKNGSLIKCREMVYNGKQELLYLPEHCKPISYYAGKFGSLTWSGILERFAAAISAVKKTGFISMCDLEPWLDRVYVDSVNGNVYLVCIPLETSFLQDERDFLYRVGEQLKGYTIGYQLYTGEKGAFLIENLCSGFFPESLCSDAPPSVSGQAQRNIINRQEELPTFCDMKTVCLCYPPMSDTVAFSINQRRFILGKKEGSADGIVTCSKRISRMHCELVRKDGKLFVKDLQSTNGTFINGMKLLPEMEAELCNGDTLQLADVQFTVKIV